MTTAKPEKSFWKHAGKAAGAVAVIALFLSNLGSIRDSVSEWVRPGPKKAAVDLVGANFVEPATVTPVDTARPATDSAHVAPEPGTDINFVETRVPASDTVDVTLLNVTGTTAVVSEATLNVRDVVHVSFTHHASALVRRSATYDFYAPPQSAPYSVSHAIAHDLKPNEADRIGFHLVGDPTDYFIIFDVTLKHSGHNSPISGKPMMHYFRGFGMHVPTRAEYDEAVAVPEPVPGQLQSTNAQEARRVRQAFLRNEDALKRLEASGATPSAAALQQLTVLRNAHKQ